MDCCLDIFYHRTRNGLHLDPTKRVFGSQERRISVHMFVVGPGLGPGPGEVADKLERENSRAAVDNTAAGKDSVDIHSYS